MEIKRDRDGGGDIEIKKYRHRGIIRDKDRVRRHKKPQRSRDRIRDR